MAFTISEQPLAYSPAYNALTYRVLSSNYTKPSMKYIFKLYVNTVLVNTSKMFPRPDGYCNYDPAQIIRNYLTAPFLNDVGYETVGSTTETANYYVVFKEEYLVATVLTEYTLTTGSTKGTWMAGSNWKYGQNLQLYIDQFLPVLNTKVSYFGPKSYATAITDSPSKLYPIRTTESKVLSFMPTNLAKSFYVNRMVVKTVTVTGSSKIFTKTLTFSLGAGANLQIFHQPVGLDSLNGTAWTTTSIPSGYTAPISATEDLRYFIWFEKQVSPGFWIQTHKMVGFEIDTCSKYDKYTVMYQCPNGGNWYVNMDMKSGKTINRTHSTMDSYLPVNYDYKNRVTKVIDIQSKGSYVLTSDWITSNDKSNEYVDMINSPIIFLIDKNEVYIPVTIEPGNYDIKNKDQDKLVNYTVVFNESFYKNSTY